MVYAAFYIARRGDLLDWLIAWRTKSRYSHVEFAFTSKPFTGGPALSFSSSPRDGGTRYTIIDFSSGKWRLLPIPWLKDDVCMAFFDAERGLKYDWTGVLAFAFKRFRESPKRWFCSEVCAAAIADQGISLPNPPHRMSPEDLYQFVVTENARASVRKAA